jgi:phospholipid/cholesterol/gamma-HCH transport system permease protein
MLTQILTWSGSRVLAVLHDAGRLWQVGSTALVRTIMVPLRGGRLRVNATSAQVVAAGNSSLALVALISLLIGMILALQSAYQLRQLGVTSLVANLVAVSMTRELAPLITAILVAGRVGSAITAELGTMKISQEIDALTVMGIDPVSLVVVPRMISLIVAVPALTVFSGLLGILGGCGVGVFVLGQRIGTGSARRLGRRGQGRGLRFHHRRRLVPARTRHRRRGRRGGALHHPCGRAVHRSDYRR